MKSPAVFALVAAAALAAAIWALSIPITGHSEPWDAEALYYPVALGVAGVISGAIIPKHLWAHYVGAILGQVAYEVVFLELGPLFMVGLVFLAGYSSIFVLGAALVAFVRRDKNHEATAA